MIFDDLIQQGVDYLIALTQLISAAIAPAVRRPNGAGIQL